MLSSRNSILSMSLGLISTLISILFIAKLESGQKRVSLLALIAGGVALDWIWIKLDLIVLTDASQFPYWLMGLWASFIALSMIAFRGAKLSLWSAALVGAIGGPLSYMAGEPLEVLTLMERPIALSVLAFEWSAVFAILVSILRSPPNTNSQA